MIFRRWWICAGRFAGNISRPGGEVSWFLADVAGSSAIVTHSDDGIRAWHNVCRHRGTRLLDPASGVLKNGCITCPYHAWTYDRNGRLIGAPNMLDDREFEREKFGLFPLRAGLFAGYVFLNLSDDGPPFEEFISPLAERLANWNLNRLRVAGSIRYEVRANWKLLFQNYSECYHCPTVHPALNQVTPYRSAANDLVAGPILGGPMQLADGFCSVTRDGSAIAPPLAGLNEVQQRGVWYYTVFPNCFVSAHPDYVMVHRLEPLDARRTTVTCEFLVENETFDEAARPAIEMWDEINRQDWRVCELTQSGVESPAFRPGPYSRLESMLAAFDRNYRELMNESIESMDD